MPGITQSARFPAGVEAQVGQMCAGEDGSVHQGWEDAPLVNRASSNTWMSLWWSRLCGWASLTWRVVCSHVASLCVSLLRNECEVCYG